MANITLTRSAEINYTARAGDTFAPPPVSFTVDTAPEDFSGCELKMQLKDTGRLIIALTNGDGIEISGNALQYSISAAAMANIPAGKYNYDVQKKDGSGIVVTIQHGTISLNKDVTK